MGDLLKVDGDSLLKLDGDKLLKVESDVGYSLSVDPCSIAITCSDVTLSRTIVAYSLSIDPCAITIICGSVDLSVTPGRVDRSWKNDINLGPSNWDFEILANKTETPHGGDVCGYWWRGESYG
jgi:hypothetical protein